MIDHHGGDGHDPASERDLGELAWRSDNVLLTTVGIDIGSTTSHLIFSRLHLQRSPSALTSRFTVVSREALFRSPILLTPYRTDETIDVDILEAFLRESYATAGLRRADVDTGAVLLTGAALERRNSRRIAELFAEEGGKFVCASAGHSLEATLAAHGSGAASLSRSTGQTVLNIDVGGGTTKLAVVRDGDVVGVMAIGVGARLVAFDGDGVLTRVEHTINPLARELGLSIAMGGTLDHDGRRRMGERIAELVIGAATRRLSQYEHQTYVLEGELPAVDVDCVTLSGGVSEVFYGRARADFGDLAGQIAEGLRAGDRKFGVPVVSPNEGIRATVMGASQFSVQASGNTLFLSDPELLPMHNLPVLAVRSETVEHGGSTGIAEELSVARRQRALEPGQPAVFALRWTGDPEYTRLRTIADGIAAAFRADTPPPPMMVVACQADVGATLGRILAEEVEVTDRLFVIDGLELTEFDFIDIGELTLPANIVPVVIKSLVFPTA